ncbi:MAG: toll/interleukin-1 receptor domain-containing protein [Clostridiales bacterium]|nr:toll/interleukin-1 receptor domain-containing protein [Clostridiales bacterium]
MAKKKKPVMTLADYLSEEGNLEKELKAQESLEEDEDFDPSMFAGVVSLEDLLEGDSEVRYLTLDNLGSLFVELKVKSKDGRTSVRRPKVYFSAYRDDYDKYFDLITDAVADELNCDIYYLEKNAEVGGGEAISQRISEMSLFVFPVTQKLLSYDGRVLDVELKAAMEYGVPIMPVYIDGDINEFNEKVGHYEVIKYSAPDFKDKLNKFINNTLFGGEDIKKIEGEFTSGIFLSYRKKDVDHARRLINVLRRDSELDDVVIWYDNYLTVGEDYNEEIASALSSCDLFALLVTPNLVGEENYVSKIEYPSASREGKKVFAVEAVPSDRKLLEKNYAGDYPVFSLGDKALTEYVKSNLKSELASAPHTPEHKYFVGLAYYFGVKVEVNRSLGGRLLLESADEGHIPALIRVLSVRRYNPDLIDDDKLIELCERALAALEKGGKIKDSDSYEAIADSLVSEYITSYQTEKAEALIVKILGLVEKAPSRRVTYYEKYARLYFRLASALEIRGRYKDAELYADFALEYAEKILESDVADAPDALYYRILGAVASAKTKCGKTDGAAEILEKAKKRFNRGGVKTSDDEKLAYAQFAVSYATALYQTGNPNEALDLAFETEKMLSALTKTDLVTDTLASVYEILGTVYFTYANGDHNLLNAALHYLEKAVDTVELIKDMSPDGKALRRAKYGLNYGAALSQCNIGEEAVSVLCDVIDACKDAYFDGGQKYLLIKEAVGALAIELVSQKKYAEAIEYYDEFFALVRRDEISSPSQYYDCANFSYRAAYIYVNMIKDRAGAETYIDKALEFIGLCDITDDNVVSLYHSVKAL